MKRCVVLDTFAGIGTGIVVLKRLGIAIEKVNMAMCPQYLHCVAFTTASSVFASSL